MYIKNNNNNYYRFGASNMKKYSHKREAILRAIQDTDTHPSASWVYERLKPEFPDLSLATVYRNIAEFVKEGLIVSVGNVNGLERYDARVHPHTHFICNCCGAVYDLCDYDDGIVDSAVTDQTGFCVERHELIFKGLCNKCSAEKVG